MRDIQNFMAADHRQCDEMFSAAEQAVAKRSWAPAMAAFTKFQKAMLTHFAVEEDLLFPAFEEKTGMRMGPTQVMRSEHVQIRELMDAMHAALQAQDAEEYAGQTETLLFMLQQHNMKEENVLYPMCDQQLTDQLDTLLAQLQNNMHGQAN